MRIAAGILMLATLGQTAWGQPTACEESASGKIGEVIVLRAPGKPERISWAIEPIAGVGLESEVVSRPGLLIDFETEGGAMKPVGAMVTVSRISRSGRQPPGLDAITLHAASGTGGSASWQADQMADGEAKIVEMLAARWPAHMKLDLIVSGKVAASAEFDLSQRQAVAALAGEARARCGQ